MQNNSSIDGDVPNTFDRSNSLPRQLRSLQWLRAIGAMSVVYFHAAIQVRHLKVGVVAPVIGETGVDIFFVLSGFIMWVTTQNSHVSPRKFFARRIQRIVPLYWLLTIAVALCAIAMPHLLRSTRFDALHVLASLSFIPWPNLAAVPGTSTYLSPIIVPGWTLNLEMTFYLLYACCLPLREGRRVASITILITALYVAGLVGARNHSIASFYGNSIIFEFLMGILLGAYLIPFLRFSKALAWALLAISIVTLAFIESAAPDLPRALKFGCPAFIAIAAAVNLERRSAVPDLPALVKLGDASYSIYLSHIIVLAGLRMAVRFLGIDGSPGTAYVFIAIALLASAIVGLLIHEYIEKPLSRIKLGLGGLNNKPRNTTPQH